MHSFSFIFQFVEAISENMCFSEKQLYINGHRTTRSPFSVFQFCVATHVELVEDDNFLYKEIGTYSLKTNNCKVHQDCI